MMNYTVSVVLSFPVSKPKAEEVLERWHRKKADLKTYMRDYRKGIRRTEGEVKQ